MDFGSCDRNGLVAGCLQFSPWPWILPRQRDREDVLNTAWPEIESQVRPGETLRSILDYLIWICREMRQLGYHAGPEREEWGRRVQRAYSSMFLPMLPGFGDPYPPDVPPAKNPGIWPDVPAAGIPGMTLRHQLTVIGILSLQMRSKIWPHIRPEEIEVWDRRLSGAREALDHGPDVSMPEDMQSAPSAEALAEAEANRAALKEKTRKRALELRRQLRAKAKKKKAAKKAPKAAKKKAAKKKASKKKAAKKKASKKKAAKKKAAKKAVKKKAAKKKAAKKAAKKKAAKKK